MLSEYKSDSYLNSSMQYINLRFTKQLFLNSLAFISSSIIILYLMYIGGSNADLNNSRQIIQRLNDQYIIMLDKTAQQNIHTMLFSIKDDENYIYMQDGISYLEWHPYDLPEGSVYSAPGWGYPASAIQKFVEESRETPDKFNIRVTCDDSCYIFLYNNYIFNRLSGYAIVALKATILLKNLDQSQQYASFFYPKRYLDNNWKESTISNEDWKRLIYFNQSSLLIQDLLLIQDEYSDKTLTFGELIDLIADKHPNDLPVTTKLNFRTQNMGRVITIVPKQDLINTLKHGITDNIPLFILLISIILITFTSSLLSLMHVQKFFHVQRHLIKKYTQNLPVRKQSGNIYTVLIQYLNETLHSAKQNDDKLDILESKLSLFSSYDAESGLPNNTWYCDRLQRAEDHLRFDSSIRLFAIMFAPVLEQKDWYDQIFIRNLSQRLSCATKEDLCLSVTAPHRYGIIVNTHKSIEEVYTVLDSIKQNISTLFPNTTESIRINAGIVRVLSSTIPPKILIGHMETAYNYALRAEGNSTYILYTENMNRNINPGDTKFEMMFTKAIKEGAINLVYTPIYNCKNKIMIGIKIRASWLKDEKLTPVDDCLEEIIHSGVNIEYSYWKIENALHELSEMDKIGGPLLNIFIPLNFGQLTDSGLMEFLNVVTVKYHIFTSRITFEITGDNLRDDITSALGAVRMLKTNNYNICMAGSPSDENMNQGFLNEYNINFISLSSAATSRIMLSEYDRFMINKYTMNTSKDFNIRIICEGIDSKVIMNVFLQNGVNLMSGRLFSTQCTNQEIIKRLKEKFIPVCLDNKIPTDQERQIKDNKEYVKTENIEEQKS